MYPVWEVPYISAGMIIAIIATFHILPSHFSVASMWYNVYVEGKAYRQNRPELLEFNRKFTRFVLIFAYIFGSLSGVGIWFAISVASPRGTSALIHNFVWGWATEWVFFLIEVSGIYIYYYTLDKIDRRTHLLIGWIFALASWITLLIITGILSFQLTPGRWLQTGRFFDGFFNPTYWQQVLTRTAFLFAIGGVFAVAVSSRLQNEAVRKLLTRVAALWGLGGLLLGALFYFWYGRVLPTAVREVYDTVVQHRFITVMEVAFLFLLLYFLWVRFRPLSVRLSLTVPAIIILYAGIFSAETVRETIRKPYVIARYMYSNQIIAGDLDAKGVSNEIASVNQKGILQVAPFVPEDLRRPTAENRLQAGRWIALIECSACHTLNASGTRPLPQMVKRLDLDEVETGEDLLEILHDSYSFMPAFVGTDAERSALAAYLVSLNQQ